MSSWKLHKYNAHHMNHPWWSSHLDFNSMLGRRSRGWWHCHDLRFLCEGGRLSEATISSYNLRNTTIHMLHNIAYMNMCFFLLSTVEILICHCLSSGDLGELPDSRGNDGHTQVVKWSHKKSRCPHLKRASCATTSLQFGNDIQNVDLGPVGCAYLPGGDGNFPWENGPMMSHIGVYAHQKHIYAMFVCMCVNVCSMYVCQYVCIHLCMYACMYGRI